MAFIPPIPLIRKKNIVKRLKQCNAVSEKSAKSFEEAGIRRPNAFGRITERLVKDGIIGKTADGKYYVL